MRSPCLASTTRWVQALNRLAVIGGDDSVASKNCVQAE
jgi:hypothetical protein